MTITRKEIITDEALNFGVAYEKNVILAIEANNKLLKTAQELDAVIVNIGKASGNKEFLQAKREEIALTDKASDLLKKESQIRQNLEKEKQQALRTQKLAIDVQNKENRQKQNSSNLTADEKLQIRLKNKEQREEAILTSKLVGAYQKLALQHKQAATNLQNLTVEYGKNNAKTKQAQAEFNKLDSRLRKADEAAKQFGRNVGNYPNQMGRAIGSLKQLATALGVVGGVTLLARELKNSVNVVRDFEKINATLSGVLQLEGDQMKALQDDAKRLGATTVKTASEVTELQLAYARLGFSQEQIIDLTEATISGSVALNANLAETAELTGAMVNSFDEFSAADAPEIMDVLSLATAKTALDFQKLQSGLPIVAGAANAAGIPFTRLTALLGKLADAGIDTSSSATALRNIFIESSKQGLSYEQILGKIANSSDKLTSSTDEFGKRAAVSANVLANAISKTEELDIALQGAVGTSQEMADKGLDTLDGAIKLLNSAWEGFILNLNDSSNAGSILTETIRFLAENLDTILTTIGILTGAWLVYRATILATSLITRAYTAGVVALRVAKIALSGGITGATRAMRLLNLQLAISPLGLFIVALTGATLLFNKYANEAKKAEEAQAAVNKRIQESTKGIREEREGLNKLVKEIINTNDNNEKRNELLRQLNEKYPSFNKFIKEEDTNNQNLNKALKEANRLYIARIALRTVEAKLNVEGARESLGAETAREAAFNDSFLAVQKNVQASSLLRDRNIELGESIDNNNRILKENLRNEEARITRAKAAGTATETEIRRLGKFGQVVSELDRIERDYIRSRVQRSDASDILKSIEEEIEATKRRLGLIDDENEFDQDAVVLKAKTAKEREDISKKEAESLKKIAEERNQALFDLNQFRIQQLLDEEKEIVDNADEAAKERLSRVNNVLRLETELLENRYNFERKKILENVKDTETANAQIKLLSEKLKTDIEAVVAEREANVEKILKDAFTKAKERIDEEKKLTKEATQGDITDLRSQLARREITYAEFQQKLKEIQDKAKTDALQAVIEQVDEELDRVELSNEEVVKLEQIKQDALDAIREEDFKKVVEREQKIAELKKQLIAETSNVLSESFGLDSTNIENFLTGIVNGFESATEAITASLNVVGDVGSAIFQGRIDDIDRQIEASEEFFNRQIELAQGDEDQQELLRQEGELRRQQLEKKKRKEQRRAAIFEKAIALTNVGVNTAAAVVKTLATTPLPIGAPLVALTIALGAIQAAAIAAKPIPKFKEGHLAGTYEGWAITNDGRRNGNVVQEVHEKKDGTAKVIQGKDTKVFMEKGDKIHKSVSDYMGLRRMGNLATLQTQGKNVDNYQALQVFNNVMSDSINEEAIIRAIKRGFKNAKINNFNQAPKGQDIDFGLWASQIENS